MRVDWWITSIIGFIVLLIGLVIWICYLRYISPEFVLKKDEWVCSRSKTETWLQPMQIGNQMLLMPMQGDVCIEYARKP